METLRNSPHQFWYYNNGITALCSSIQKKMVGGSSRDTGIFECRGVTIVNGAQTVGAAATAFSQDHRSVENARILLRLISLDQCPPEFAISVTRSTNTQNRIELRDFVSLDEQQQRLQTELQLDDVRYVYKSGDSIASTDNGFDLDEATVALACAHQDVALSVQAKREIGKLWEDTSKQPYRTHFNQALSGRRLWRLVQIQRRVDSQLRLLGPKEIGARSNDTGSWE